MSQTALICISIPDPDPLCKTRLNAPVNVWSGLCGSKPSRTYEIANGGDVAQPRAFLVLIFMSIALRLRAQRLDAALPSADSQASAFPTLK